MKARSVGGEKGEVATCIEIDLGRCGVVVDGVVNLGVPETKVRGSYQI